MAPTVEFLIKPMTIRFGLWEGEPVYHVAADADTQLDGMEKLMGIDIDEREIFDMNLGFLPLSTTTLIETDTRTIVVDPGNFHVGFYRLLTRRLDELGYAVDDVDTVVLTHFHMDHMASTHRFEGADLIVGEGELDAAREAHWPELVDALTVDRLGEVTTVSEDDDMREIAPGVSAFSTPGHSPASISLLVETEAEEIAVVGDTAMTRTDYTERDLSHWYTDEQVELLHASLDRIEALEPTMIVPGHDQPFRP